jgi:hypothetical protein
VSKLEPITIIDTIKSSHIDVDIERAMKRTFISPQEETSLCWGKLLLVESIPNSKEEFVLNKSIIRIGANQSKYQLLYMLCIFLYRLTNIALTSSIRCSII